MRSLRCWDCKYYVGDGNGRVGFEKVMVGRAPLEKRDGVGEAQGV